MRGKSAARDEGAGARGAFGLFADAATEGTAGAVDMRIKGWRAKLDAGICESFLSAIGELVLGSEEERCGLSSNLYSCVTWGFG